ncbi:hypothetical protein B566_EDAN016948 [Ephemera danica]|nr:hypothetical protein B566_EDAN016948 [Ephemera danica]
MKKGQVRALWVGCLIALPSGAGVALSVLGGNAGSLVGVAISASLLPPAVNAGLLWALAVIELLRATSDPYHYLSHDLEERLNSTDPAKPTYFYSDYKPAELAALGAVSLCLTLLNIACIFVAGIIVLKADEGTGGHVERQVERRG